MGRLNTDLLVKLFNVNKLTLKDAYWLNTKGYYIICSDKKVISIKKEKE